MGALDLFEQDDRLLLRQCRNKGEYLLRRLRELRARYPGQLRDVRGRGLMIGLELEPPLHSRSPLLRVVSEQGLLGYFAAGYLLHEERIRVAPGLSAHDTLRLEPSAAIDEAGLDHAYAAIERLCRLIRDADIPRLCRLAVARHAPPAVEAVKVSDAGDDERLLPASKLAASDLRIGFLLHYMQPSDLRRMEPGFRGFDDGACADFIDKTRRVLAPFVAERHRVHSPAGPSVELSFIVIPFSAAHVMQAMRERSFASELKLVKDGVELARSLGCACVGLGGYTSIVSNNCTAIVSDEIGLTSGNALTVATAVEALFAAATRRGIVRRRLGVVGATGNIGALIAELAAPEVDELVLIGRPSGTRRLAELAGRLPARVRIATELDALRSCSLVVCASNSPTPIVLPEHIAVDASVVVCDVAVPGDVADALRAERPNAHVIGGGLMRLPLGQDLGSVGVEGAPGVVYACMAETIALGLARFTKHFSYGALRLADVHFIRELARTHGFTTEEKVL